MVAWSPDIIAPYISPPVQNAINSNASTAAAAAAAAAAANSSTGAAASNPYAPRHLSVQQVAEYAKAGGFRGQALITATAVAMAESSGETDALGPPISHPESWVGPYPQAMGLWQILPAWNDSGYTGNGSGTAWSHTGPRDARRLNDPTFNAHSAYSISSGGKSFHPWSTYTSGAYRTHLTDAARAAAALGQTPVPGSSTGTSTGTPVVDTAWATAHLQPIRLGGTAKPGDLGNVVIAGQLDASVKQPSQLTLTFADEDLSLLTTGQLQPSARFLLDTQKFTVVDVQIVDTGAGAGVQVQALPSGIAALMHTTAPKATGVQPRDYLRLLTRAVGVPLQKDSGPGWKKNDIAPQLVDVTQANIDTVVAVLDPYAPKAGANKRYENAWEVAQRLAVASGYDLWEDEAGLFFGPASDLASSGFGRAAVTWPGNPGKPQPGAIEALNVPSVTFSVPAQGRYARVSVQMQLPPEARGRVHIGHGIDMALGALLTKRIYTAAGDTEHLLRVSRITWQIGDLTAPLAVEAESAVDVIGPDNPFAGDQTPVPSAPGSGSGSTSSLPRGATPLSPAQAADRADSQVGAANQVGTCMAWVGHQFGLAYSGWPLARDGWYGTPAFKRHPGDKNPPRGAVVYWDGGSAGHVAIATGDGDVYSTDAPQIGRVGEVAIDWVISNWRNKTYLGWTEPYFPHGG